jgi:hypothetical protein
MKACIIMHNMIIEDEGDHAGMDIGIGEKTNEGSISHEKNF